MTFAIEEMQRSDWAQVRTIQGEGLATGLAAFMTVPPKWNSWDEGHLALGRLVARADDGSVLGWVALTPAPDT